MRMDRLAMSCVSALSRGLRPNLAPDFQPRFPYTTYTSYDGVATKHATRGRACQHSPHDGYCRLLYVGFSRHGIASSRAAEHEEVQDLPLGTYGTCVARANKVEP